jgi:hypothetical protein
MKIFAIALLFMGTLFNSYAQNTFSADREKFVKEFQKVLTDYGKGEDIHTNGGDLQFDDYKEIKSLSGSLQLCLFCILIVRWETIRN